MKIIKSAQVKGVTPRGQAASMVQQPAVQQPAPVQPVANPQVNNQQLPGSNIISNTEPINDQMLKNLLTKYRNGLNKLISGVKTLPDNEIEILIADLNQSFQLIVKSIRDHRKATQITNSQINQQQKQMLQNAPK